MAVRAGVALHAVALGELAGTTMAGEFALPIAHAIAMVRILLHLWPFHRVPLVPIFSFFHAESNACGKAGCCASHRPMRHLAAYLVAPLLVGELYDNRKAYRPRVHGLEHNRRGVFKPGSPKGMHFTTL